MTPKQLLKLSEAYAKKAGYKMYPDKKQIARILKGLQANEKKFGYRYCPCRIVTGNFDNDRNIICPCIFHKQEIKRQGHCLCRFFCAKNFKIKK
jgi:ferredoxin-thioredoxin reductase catalytic subunit